jgi:hypothetical protein
MGKRGYRNVRRIQTCPGHPCDRDCFDKASRAALKGLSALPAGAPSVVETISRTQSSTGRAASPLAAVLVIHTRTRKRHHGKAVILERPKDSNVSRHPCDRDCFDKASRAALKGLSALPGGAASVVETISRTQSSTGRAASPLAAVLAIHMRTGKRHHGKAVTLERPMDSNVSRHPCDHDCFYKATRAALKGLSALPAGAPSVSSVVETISRPRNSTGRAASPLAAVLAIHTRTRKRHHGKAVTLERPMDSNVSGHPCDRGCFDKATRAALKGLSALPAGAPSVVETISRPRNSTGREASPLAAVLAIHTRTRKRLHGKAVTLERPMDSNVSGHPCDRDCFDKASRAALKGLSALPAGAPSVVETISRPRNSTGRAASPLAAVLAIHTSTQKRPHGKAVTLERPMDSNVSRHPCDRDCFDKATRAALKGLSALPAGAPSVVETISRTRNPTGRAASPLAAVLAIHTRTRKRPHGKAVILERPMDSNVSGHPCDRDWFDKATRAALKGLSALPAGAPSVSSVPSVVDTNSAKKIFQNIIDKITPPPYCCCHKARRFSGDELFKRAF